MKRVLLVLISLLVLFFSIGDAPVSALTPSQRNVLDSGVRYFNVEDTQAGCSLNLNLSGAEIAEKIWGFFIDKGLTPPQAAGIMGNLQAESGLNPRRVQGTPTPAGDRDVMAIDGKTGYGLAQWTDLSRQKRLHSAALAAGTQDSDLAVQLNFLWSEMSGLLERIKALDDVAAVTSLFMLKFERPKDQSQSAQDARTRLSRDILARFGSGTTTGASAPPVVSGCSIGVSGCPSEPVPQSEIVVVQGIEVHPCIAQEVERIMTLARQQGLTLGGGGYRSNEEQIALRIAHGCGGNQIYDRSCKGTPPTAVPGKSNHERGTAIDFTCNGGRIGSRSNECFIFLHANTTLINYSKEPWHWSHDGR